MKLGLFVLFFNFAASQCSQDVSIKSEADLLRVKNCTRVEGSLVIDVAEPLSVEFPLLEHAVDLGISGAGVQAIRFPKLRYVRRISIVQTPNAASFEVPSLRDAVEIAFFSIGNVSEVRFDAGLTLLKSLLVVDTQIQQIHGISARYMEYLEAERNPNLVMLNLPDLKGISASLLIKSNHPKLNMHAPKLSHVTGNLAFSGGSDVHLDSLKSLGGYIFLNELSATSISLPLESVGNSLTIKKCPNLKTLSLQELQSVATRTSIYDNPQLVSLDLGSLKTVNGDLVIIAHSLTNLTTSSELRTNFSTTLVSQTNCSQFLAAHGPWEQTPVCTSTSE
ncbi:protoplasts-secreted [Entomophthora muscae]|uniref:Protoplasts-secreted n=1 Tax=Entomophthora muscae TaxID=34485 RepID=A0ACC2RXG3_9FUNG|nr:protoplasts-secreted [Entomophthora muscae]